jgi:hypothetical protein
MTESVRVWYPERTRHNVKKVKLKYLQKMAIVRQGCHSTQEIKRSNINQPDSQGRNAYGLISFPVNCHEAGNCSGKYNHNIDMVGK